MVDRGLLFKEWKQHQTMLLMISIFTIFSYPLYIVTQYTNYRVCMRDNADEYYFTCDFSLDASPLQMYFVAGIILAIIQICLERNKGIMDFTLGLPFNRRTIFRSKAVIGTLVIWGSQLLSFIFSLCLIGILRPDLGNFYSFFLWSTITCFMFYMLMLAAGAMTGSIVAQLMVGLTASILPMLIYALLFAHIDIIAPIHGENLFSSIYTFVAYITPTAYVSIETLFGGVFVGTETIEPMFVVPLILSFLFYWIGLVCFDKLPNEREGYFFLEEKMNKPIQLLVISFGILGFGLFGYVSMDSLFGYLVGVVIGAVIGFLLSYFLIFKKSKLL